MKIPTLIVDDEGDARTLLKIYLKGNKDLAIIAEGSNGKEALQLINELNPQIVILDIQMPELNGVEVVRNCRPPYPYFIFVTAYDEYAIQAFELNALDYILKPFSQARLEDAIAKALSHIQAKKLLELSKKYQSLFQDFQSRRNFNDFLQKIAVKINHRTHFIDVSNISFIQAANQYVYINTKGNKHLIRDSLTHLEKVLDPALFFRTHRSYLVNLNRVETLEHSGTGSSTILLKDGNRIPLTNERKKTFIQKMKKA